MTPLPGQVIADRYRLDRRLSEGGMGAVWLATHRELEAPVAVKFMHARLVESLEARGRFTREARAAAQIRSPHVVHIYDHGIDDDTPFIVMEYLEGEDLGQLLKRVGQLPVAEAVRICSQVCKGLERAHALGIIHRDLKPANLFLCSDGEGTVKLLDFGIAKEMGREQLSDADPTTTGTLLGSPQYLSPEQARGLPVDHRADLWSLAVILFRALTGRKMFDTRDVGDMIVRICSEPIPSVRSLRPELPPAIDEFFERALGRNREDRFPSAALFAEAFAAALTPSATPSEDRSLIASVGGEAGWSSSPSSQSVSSPPIAAQSTVGAPVAPHVTPSSAVVEPPRANDSERAAPPASQARRRSVVLGVAVLSVLAAAGVLAARKLAPQGVEPSVRAPDAATAPIASQGESNELPAGSSGTQGSAGAAADRTGSGGTADVPPDDPMDASTPSERARPRRPPKPRPTARPGTADATSPPGTGLPDLGY